MSKNITVCPPSKASKEDRKRRRRDRLQEIRAGQPRPTPEERARYGPGYGWDFMWYSEIDGKPCFAWYRKERTS